MKNHFPIGFLGNLGPEVIIVRLTPAEIGQRLQHALKNDSFIDALFTTEVHYTGIIKENGFTMQMCRQARGTQRPTLVAMLEPTEAGTRIRFHIEPEYWLIGLIVGFPVVAMVGFMLTFNSAFPFYFLPLLSMPVFLLNSIFTRVWSNRLLHFFLATFDDRRIA